jgi:hypothetical protein
MLSKEQEKEVEEEDSFDKNSAVVVLTPPIKIQKNILHNFLTREAYD